MDPCFDPFAMDVDLPIDPSAASFASLTEAEASKHSFCPICNCESFSSFELCPHLLSSCDLENDLKAFFKEYSPKNSFSLPPTPASLQCDFCHTSCKNLKGLRQHIGKMHEAKKKSSQCPQCEKRFKNKYAVKFHMRQVHEKTTRVSCPHCGKSMYNKYWLQEHIQTAHGLL